MFTLRWSVSEHPERWAGAVFLLSLTAFLWIGVLPAVRSWGAAPKLIADRVQQVQFAAEAIPSEVVADALPMVLAEVDKQATAGIREIRAARVEILGKDGQFTQIRGDVMELAGLLSGRIGEGLQEIQDLRASVAPAIANINQASAELPGALRDGRFLLARSARAVGHIEQASDKIEAAVPRMIQIAEQTGGNIQRATDESALTAQQSRIFMGHLSEATKPIPAWARIGLAVAPPVVQTGFTVGSWLALRGKSK